MNTAVLTRSSAIRTFWSDEDTVPSLPSLCGQDSQSFSKTTASHALPAPELSPSTSGHRPYGLLKQLPIPEKPWNLISMDFIEQLPASSSYTSILVIVDHLSKQLLFIPTYNTIMSQQLAQ